eukprot:7839784-Karenia_brevis.AAC.1
MSWHSDPIAQRVACVAQQLDDISHRYKTVVAAQIVGLRDEALACLGTPGLIVPSVESIAVLGFHPLNRGRR